MSFGQLPLNAPFQGIVDHIPAPYRPPASFDELLNMWVYRGRLITRPRLNDFTVNPDGSIIWNIVPFLDIEGHLHNLILASNNIYMLTPGPVWNGPLEVQPWVSTVTYQPGDIVRTDFTHWWVATATSTNQAPPNAAFWQPIPTGSGATGVPYGVNISQGRVYFSNGSLPGLYSDGEAMLKSMFTPGSFRFIAVLANHMVVANTTEPPPGTNGATDYPYRVRWSDNGNATNWIEGSATSAGHQDLLDVPDQITGLATLGRSGFVFRTNGITQMTPTGLGASPFQFDALSTAPHGVGNFYPYSLTVYGTIAMFVSEDDVWSFDGSSFIPVGGVVKPRLFHDIADANASRIIGMLFVRCNPQFKYLSYWISIPLTATSLPVTWVYSFDSQSWQRFQGGDALRQTAIANIVI